MTSILAVWSEQQNSSPSYVSFNKQIAIGASRPSLSLWTEYDLFERRNQIQQSLTETSIFAFPLATIFGTISLLWRGRVRKVAGVLAILFVLLSASSGAAKFLSTLFVPGTYAFLDDYVYVENIDLHHATGMIAAYDWRGPPQGWPNVLAFDDGRVEILVDEHRARLLFEQQGLAYPEPKERDKDND